MADFCTRPVLRISVVAKLAAGVDPMDPDIMANPTVAHWIETFKTNINQGVLSVDTKVLKNGNLSFRTRITPQQLSEWITKVEGLPWFQDPDNRWNEIRVFCSEWAAASGTNLVSGKTTKTGASYMQMCERLRGKLRKFTDPDGTTYKGATYDTLLEEEREYQRIHYHRDLVADHYRTAWNTVKAEWMAEFGEHKIFATGQKVSPKPEGGEGESAGSKASKKA